MKINYRRESKGSCKSCGSMKPSPLRFYKVFEEVSEFRGEDEYLGKFCRDCFRAKKYLIKGLVRK